jgi:hypothetical protein
MAKWILKATTSDNIQPLARLVAEAFGNTLVICPQAQLLVEKRASKRHKSHVLKFLQAQIGYAADDSALHLSSTSAGRHRHDPEFDPTLLEWAIVPILGVQVENR